MNFPNGFHFKNLTKESLNDLHNTFYDHFKKYDFEDFSSNDFEDLGDLKESENDDVYLDHLGDVLYGFSMLHDFFEFEGLKSVKVKLCLDFGFDYVDDNSEVETINKVHERLDEIKASWKDFDYEEIFE